MVSNMAEDGWEENPAARAKAQAFKMSVLAARLKPYPCYKAPRVEFLRSLNAVRLLHDSLSLASSVRAVAVSPF